MKLLEPLSALGSLKMENGQVNEKKGERTIAKKKKKRGREEGALFYVLRQLLFPHQDQKFIYVSKSGWEN